MGHVHACHWYDSSESPTMVHLDFQGMLKQEVKSEFRKDCLLHAIKTRQSSFQEQADPIKAKCGSMVPYVTRTKVLLEVDLRLWSFQNQVILRTDYFTAAFSIVPERNHSYFHRLVSTCQ
jgi:hypothetical protein